MAPKEKAQQLFDLMFEEIYNKGMYDDLYRAKQCALIAVDEVVYNIEPSVSMDVISARIKYWEQVKQEIEKL
jgi:hypothetical protein